MIWHTSSPLLQADASIDEDQWSAAMRRGDFAAAWQISDAVLQQRLASSESCHHWPRHLQYIWNGAPLAGKSVLIRCYHGLGDTIQFIRFAAPLRRLAREVIVWAQPALLDLIADAPGVDRVVPLHDGTPDVEYEVDIEIMELAHALRATATSIQQGIPYLVPRALVPPLPDNGPVRVGIVWQAGGWDRRRSIPARALTPLREVPGIELYSLQRGAEGGQSLPGAVDVSSDDVAVAAARIQQLDLVVTVDTMIAHLTGALGKPVWTLLHADCDWRWAEDDGLSLWYPTMRIFRQKTAGDWVPVIESVRQSLQ
jgi:hypothetical protein